MRLCHFPECLCVQTSSFLGPRTCKEQCGSSVTCRMMLASPMPPAKTLSKQSRIARFGVDINLEARLDTLESQPQGQHRPHHLLVALGCFGAGHKRRGWRPHLGLSTSVCSHLVPGGAGLGSRECVPRKTREQQFRQGCHVPPGRPAVWVPTSRPARPSHSPGQRRSWPGAPAPHSSRS